MLRGYGPVSSFEHDESPDTFGQLHRVNESFLPSVIKHKFSTKYIAAAHNELLGYALENTDGCYGYFPDLFDREGINSNLSAASRFADRYPIVKINNVPFKFSFLRVSVRPQPTQSGKMHVDSNVQSGLSYDSSTVPSEGPAWRAHFNLSNEFSKVLDYSVQAPTLINATPENGITYYWTHPAARRSIEIVKRHKRLAHGVLFCANRVVHGANNRAAIGEFVASYGYEQPA
jgi:hypothetical protein